MPVFSPFLPRIPFPLSNQLHRIACFVSSLLMLPSILRLCLGGMMTSSSVAAIKKVHSLAAISWEVTIVALWFHLKECLLGFNTRKHRSLKCCP
ncbi:hypothetical protein Ancab_028562 [Ancistrocladus abbreviatus]